MATALSESGLEEGEYESDSDGASALAPRRREASDDDERGMVLDAASSADDDASRPLFSDDEGEGEGTPLIDEDEEEEDEDTDGLLRRRRKGSDEEDDNEVEGEGLHQGEGSQELGHPRKSGEKKEGVQGNAAGDIAEGKEGGEEEKKESEPFVVPTAGAFYMHDDRFRENGGARPRRSMGGRKLWEAKDEKPWVHDLFEDLNVRDDSFSGEGLPRSGRGRSRGRGRGRDRGRGWIGRLASDQEEFNINRARRGRGRGRAPRTEVVDNSRAEEPLSTTNTYGSKGTQDTLEGSNSDGQQARKQHESPAPLRKLATGSLNSASPPFFPSGALQQQKSGDGSENNQSNFSQSKGREKVSKNTGSPGTTVFVAKPTAASGRGAQGDGLLLAKVQSHTAKPPTTHPTAQSGRGSSNQALVTLSPQPQAQPQHLQQPQGQQAQAPSNSRSSSWSSQGNAGQPTTNRNGAGRGGRGGNFQVGGRGGSYLYNGGPAVRMGDPSFSPTIPAVGPVAVQYGGRAQAGMAVPAVGMAMPSYSGQPQFGFSNSEVAWVPVLAGGGAIGTGYAAPYMTMEGTPSPMYYTQPATQLPSFRPTGRGELNGSKPSGLWKPPPNQELGTDEFGQRQSKPRRYSEMSFGQ